MKILMRNYHYVRTLDELLSDKASSKSRVVRFLEMVMRDRMWKKRFIPELSRKVAFEDFAEFVGAARPECLGTTVEKLKMRCTYNQHAVDMIERELSGKDA